MPDYYLNLTPGNVTTIPTVNAQSGKTVQLYTSDGTSVNVSFSDGTAFTDGVDSFDVGASPGVTKTTSASAGNHNYSAGSRTGDINIIDDV